MEEISHPRILSGLVVRDAIREKLASQVSTFLTPPTLMIIQVGDREDSNTYIREKINFGASIGMEVKVKKLKETITEAELEEEIHVHNTDTSVTGIIVQLPLPVHISKHILEHIKPLKDVDCLTAYHEERLKNGDVRSAPATARAIRTLLEYYTIPVASRHIVIVGRSRLVGGPTATLLRLSGAKVSVIHRQTENPKAISQSADVLVVACGVPQLITEEWINPSLHTVVVDVGIHRTETGLVGDVDFDRVKGSVSAISPVPGGVGPLTVASLFEHLVSTHVQSLV
ncbi:MAG: bifunctional 5,10-methylenetetrahydrofolate dehydrogenase/5,10-methenyltetrahydrofolate cyclohydrolase [Candidatus Zambryskibacteria bacterium]|nr:bifunctional 5,10-methylenetetrahydrofolate dehydrogenase/5,10-methenyltetrahydrofolate cyclohydrolase [Candidatus Zambryskibacteria bacterium]